MWSVLGCWQWQEKYERKGHTLVHYKHAENQGNDTTIGRSDHFLQKCHFTHILGHIEEIKVFGITVPI